MNAGGTTRHPTRRRLPRTPGRAMHTNPRRPSHPTGTPRDWASNESRRPSTRSRRRRQPAASASHRPDTDTTASKPPERHSPMTRYDTSHALHGTAPARQLAKPHQPFPRPSTQTAGITPRHAPRTMETKTENTSSPIRREPFAGRARTHDAGKGLDRRRDPATTNNRNRPGPPTARHNVAGKD